MDVLGCLPAYVFITSTILVLSTEAGKKATVYGLVLDCRGNWRVVHLGEGILEWLITGNIYVLSISSSIVITHAHIFESGISILNIMTILLNP